MADSSELRMNRSRFLLLTPFAVILALGCGGGGGDNPPAPKPGLSLSLNPTSVSVEQGQSGTTQVTAVRSNGETGAIALSLSGAPSGVSGSGTIASASNAGVFTVQVASSAVPGTYPLTVQGSDGSLSPTASLSLLVKAHQANTWQFDASAKIAFFAYQDGTGAWTPVTGAGGVYTFSMTQAKGAVVYVKEDTAGGTSDVVLTYGSLSELANQDLRVAGDGLTVTGTFTGMGATDAVDLSLGSEGYAYGLGAGTGIWTMDFVNKGTHDLLALQSDQNQVPKRLIMHRGINVTASGSLGAAGSVDFGSEGATLTPQHFTVTGAELGAGGLMTGWQTFETDFGSALLATSSMTSTPVLSTYAVPEAGMVANDRHSYFFQIGPDDGTGTIDAGNNRTQYVFKHGGGDLVVDAAADMGLPVTAVTGNSPYTRIRTQWSFDSLFSQKFTARFSQAAKSWTFSLTPAYGSVDVTLPDLSGVAGWKNSWGLVSGAAITSRFQGYGRTWTTWPPADGARSHQSIRTTTINP